MNNNTIRIQNYLDNEMNAEEKTAFENELQFSEALRNEFHAQQKVLMAIKDAGIKTEFAKAIRQRLVIKRWVTWGSLAAACIIGILIYNNRPSSTAINNLPSSPAEMVKQLFINPPLPVANVPYHRYQFEAERGDTIVYPSGSVICFPASSLVDKAGNLVKGTVTVTYREFADPLDFFVSGIPMSYDSAGQKYIFESAGMCELNAYQNNAPLFVNQAAQPQINLSCINSNRVQNVYFLDTVKRSWQFTGKDSITAVRTLAKTNPAANIQSVEQTVSTVEKPVKPIRSSEDKQHFSIEIEPGSFEELQSYNGLKFEVMDESNYNRSDANEQWEDVKLTRTNTAGIYDVRFSRPGRTVSYKVRPVLEGTDYDNALKIFEEKNKNYQAALKNRLSKEKDFCDSIEILRKKIEAQNEIDFAENERMNKLIITRNKKLREIKKKLLEQSLNDIQNRLQQTNDRFLFARYTDKTQSDASSRAEIIRTFRVPNFGTWNCDQPILPKNTIPIVAEFRNYSGNIIQLQYITLVREAFNGIQDQIVENNLIAVEPEKQNMLWAVQNSSFYFFTYKDYATAAINRNTKNVVFKMRKADKQISSYNDIRELVDKL